MKFSAALALVSTAVATSSVIYETDVVTNTHSTDVTITSCSDNACETTVQASTTSVVTATVDGVLTVYTTVCPLTETTSSSVETPVASTTSVVTTTIDGVMTIYTTVCPLTETTSTAEATSSAEVAAVESSSTLASLQAAEVSSDSDVYVDETVTPTVVVSTGILSTAYAQSTLFSTYNGTTSSTPEVSTYSGVAPRNALAGVAGVGALGVAALLL